jgi:DNA polymerase III alpha subunit (gram-positive type)
MVAHNAAFDLEMVKKEGIAPKNVVCTMKLARFLDKEGVIPHYGLQYLRYYLDIRIEATHTLPWETFWCWKASSIESMRKLSLNSAMMPLPK